MSEITRDPSIAPLEVGDRDRVAGPLTRAFLDDPTQAWCFESQRPGYEDRLRGYLEVGHVWHLEQGHLAWGVVTDGRLVGALYLNSPDVESPEKAVRDLERRLVSACGERAAARFARYNRAVEERCPEGRYFILALAAVEPQWQRQGFGSRLIKHACEVADADASSEGTLLDSGSPDAIRLYQRHGYRVTDEVEIDGLRESILFRLRLGSYR